MIQGYPILNQHTKLQRIIKNHRKAKSKMKQVK